ncbi:hypothetical protein V2J09_004523 [Rumex salicifolius]
MRPIPSVRNPKPREHRLLLRTIALQTSRFYFNAFRSSVYLYLLRVLIVVAAIARIGWEDNAKNCFELFYKLQLGASKG